MITTLEAKAFKGLKKFSIEPKSINLLIGANGTGKTNFADLIEFISVACRFGLKEAFDKLDGFDEVRTKMSGRGRPPVFSVCLSLDSDPYRGIKKVNYKFSLSPEKYPFIEEEILDAVVYRRSQGKPAPPAKVNFDQANSVKIFFTRKRRAIEKWSASLGEDPKEFGDDEDLILNAYGKLGNFKTVSDYLGAMRVYNIDSMLAKASSNGSDAELDRYGNNLITFLKRVIEDAGMREQLLEDLRRAVPYIEDIKPERKFGYTTLKFSEFDSGLDLRAKQMSYGTIRLLGLLAVLRQPVPPPVVVIEEPENALHSFAIRSFVSIMQEMSCADRFSIQSFLTSHSPAVVDAVLNVESLTNFPTQGFVSRRKDGASTIEPTPDNVMRSIIKNLGRPSDFLREGSFQDKPKQLELPL